MRVTRARKAIDATQSSDAEPRPSMDRDFSVTALTAEEVIYARLAGRAVALCAKFWMAVALGIIGGSVSLWLPGLIASIRGVH